VFNANRENISQRGDVARVYAVTFHRLGIRADERSGPQSSRDARGARSEKAHGLAIPWARPGRVM
jgi:hypothetical protein